MPIFERESYLGKPTEQDERLVFPLSTHLQENLQDICELVIEVFEAKSCGIAVEYDRKVALIHGSFESQSKMQSENSQFIYENGIKKLHDSDFATIESFEAAQEQVVCVPIKVLSNLKLGALIFTRDAGKAQTQELSRKDKRILRLIGRDIENFFIQRRESFEIEQSSELQILISQLNHDWIFVKDKDFKIVYANEAFLQVYPEDMRDSVIGYTTIEEYDEQEAEKFLKYDKIAFNEGISETIEDLHMPDGSHMIVATTKQRFEDKSGSAYILCVCRDITKQEELIRKLQKANQELDDFASIASHDLKAPLNAIRRLLAWIHEESAEVISDNAKENLDFVVSRAERMHSLLNDLLSFAKIGRDQQKYEQLSLKKSVDEMKLLIDVPGDFEITCDDVIIHVPTVPFNTVMLNLISNAFKHNDKARPTIDVSASVTKHYYIIKVKDNGPGIPKQYQDRVFKLFQTLRPRDEVEGSGMGLSVVKKYVESYQGQLKLSSDGESGCEFTIWWPVTHSS
ncbi:sensor histidine kinase [Ningiella sp. W23]|uniref:sensor histidine kinase n=1 Tax=Ningiella sp. W23 TaxID=3023715 RepID=UPI003757B330